MAKLSRTLTFLLIILCLIVGYVHADPKYIHDFEQDEVSWLFVNLREIANGQQGVTSLWNVALRALAVSTTQNEDIAYVKNQMAMFADNPDSLTPNGIRYCIQAFESAALTDTLLLNELKNRFGRIQRQTPEGSIEEYHDEIRDNAFYWDNEYKSRWGMNHDFFDHWDKVRGATEDSIPFDERFYHKYHTPDILMFLSFTNPTLRVQQCAYNLLTTENTTISATPSDRLLKFYPTKSSRFDWESIILMFDTQKLYWTKQDRIKIASRLLELNYGEKEEKKVLKSIVN